MIKKLFVAALAGAALIASPVLAAGFPVGTPGNPSTAQYGQLAVTTTAQQLATPVTGVNGVVCTASPNNTTDILVGRSGVTTAEDGTGSGYPIPPGGSWSEGITTTAGLYFISSATAVLFCHGN